jgi:hypothetical protein
MNGSVMSGTARPCPTYAGSRPRAGYREDGGTRPVSSRWTNCRTLGVAHDPTSQAPTARAPEARRLTADVTDARALLNALSENSKLADDAVMHATHAVEVADQRDAAHRKRLLANLNRERRPSPRSSV